MERAQNLVAGSLLWVLRVQDVQELLLCLQNNQPGSC
jgi:hypothetical protein